MKEGVIDDLILESLAIGIPTLTKDKASMLKEACVWCLMKCDHSPGVEIQSVTCEKPALHRIVWDHQSIDLDRVLLAYNSDDAIEFGAEAVALLLVREQTPFTAIRRAVKKTGIDYWLGYKTEDPNIVFGKADARLEVSGILEERGSNTIKNRIKKKLQQTVPTDHIFPVYVSVVEFSNPKAETVLKHANN